MLSYDILIKIIYIIVYTMSAPHKLLDPKNDVAFKRIFGTEKNKDILIHFLNDMLIFRGHPHIVNVTFLSPIQDPEIASQKTSIVDVLCQDQNGNTYIVEMQVASTKGFEKRAQYYAAKAYASQLDVGGFYENLKEVVFLAIADYVMFPNKEALKSDHVILDRESYDHDLKDFSFSFLELGKFQKHHIDISSLENNAEKWCYFFKYAESADPEVIEGLLKRDLILTKAIKELDRFYWTKEDLASYEEAEKRKRDYLSSLEKRFEEGQALGLEKGKREGEAIGLEKGEAIGLEKGEAIGLEKGKKEMALKMLEKNIPDDTIVEFTGLAHAELNALKNESTK